MSGPRVAEARESKALPEEAIRLNHSKLNIIVDLAGFICAVFLLEYTLPPGSGRLGTEGFGLAQGGLRRPILLFVGFDATRTA